MQAQGRRERWKWARGAGRGRQDVGSLSQLSGRSLPRVLAPRTLGCAKQVVVVPTLEEPHRGRPPHTLHPHSIVKPLVKNFTFTVQFQQSSADKIESTDGLVRCNPLVPSPRGWGIPARVNRPLEQVALPPGERFLDVLRWTDDAVLEGAHLNRTPTRHPHPPAEATHEADRRLFPRPGTASSCGHPPFLPPPS